MLKPSDIGHISIHAPLTGSDKRIHNTCNFFRYFNPRSPHRERRSLKLCKCCFPIFQSTLPSQGATFTALGGSPVNVISIHAPLTGSDGDIYDQN